MIFSILYNFPQGYVLFVQAHGSLCLTVSAAEKNDAATLLHRGDGIIQVAGIWLVPDTVLGNQAKELNFLSCQTRQSFSSHAQSPVCHLARYERAFVGVFLKSGFVLVFHLPTEL